MYTIVKFVNFSALGNLKNKNPKNVIILKTPYIPRLYRRDKTWGPMKASRSRGS